STGSTENKETINFMHGGSDVSNLPISQWAEVMNRELRKVEPNILMKHPDPCGFRPLRQAIAEMLFATREIQCSYDQVIVLSGFSLATDLIARIHCDSNDTILIEEPSQPSLKNVLLSYGANLHPVAIDNSGLQTDELPDWDDYSKLK